MITDCHLLRFSQMQLLRLVLSIMILEDQLVSLKASGITGSSLSAVGKVKKRLEESRKKMTGIKQTVAGKVSFNCLENYLFGRSMWPRWFPNCNDWHLRSSVMIVTAKCMKFSTPPP